jgi:hypothetical protein
MAARCPKYQKMRRHWECCPLRLFDDQYIHGFPTSFLRFFYKSAPLHQYYKPNRPSADYLLSVLYSPLVRPAREVVNALARNVFGTIGPA